MFILSWLLSYHIRVTIIKLCRECEICAEDHTDLTIIVTFHSEAFSSGFKYGADIGKIDRHPHLIVVDYYSFAIFEHSLPSLATTLVITAFKTISSNTGIPMTLVTDNATCFVSEEFNEFAKNACVENSTLTGFQRIA